MADEKNPFYDIRMAVQELENEMPKYKTLPELDKLQIYVSLMQIFKELLDIEEAFGVRVESLKDFEHKKDKLRRLDKLP